MSSVNPITTAPVISQELPPLTDIQQIVETKLNAAVTQVRAKVLIALMSGYATLKISAKIPAQCLKSIIGLIDFFHMMMTAIDEDLNNKIPNLLVPYIIRNYNETIRRFREWKNNGSSTN